MLVYYKLVSGGSYTLLFDESAGDANETFAPQFRDTLLKIGGYGAANMLKVPLANTDGTISFKFSKNYASADAGLTGIVTLRSTFKGVSVHLKITVGAVTAYLPNAQLASSSHDQHGREVLHTLTFETDDLTTTAP